MAFSQSVKDAVKKRSGGRCECTRKSCANHNGRCSSRGAEYNHIVSVLAGGHDGLSNCELLCATCHQNTRSYGRH